MCNTRTITYSCEHIIPFRLSTCRAKFTYKNRKSPTGESPSCRSGNPLCFKSDQQCGACIKAVADKQLEEKIFLRRLELTPDDWLAEPSAELVVAEVEYESDKWRLTKTYPYLARFKKDVRPENGPPATRSESLLKREVKAEDVVLKPNANRKAITASWDDEAWGDDWTSLGQEIAETDAERVDESVPTFTDCTYAWGDEGQDGDLEAEAAELESAEDEVSRVMDCKSTPHATCVVGKDDC